VDASVAYVKENFKNITMLPKHFTVYAVDDHLYVSLDQVDLEDGFTQERKPGAYFELDRKSLTVKKFELCSNECGVFAVRWFKMPNK
jgi:hypothetical protein